MKKILNKSIAVCLILTLVLPHNALLFAFDDDDGWDGFDGSLPTTIAPEPAPPPPPPSYDFQTAPEPYAPAARDDAFGEFYGEQPAVAAEPEPPSYGSFSIDDSYSLSGPSLVDAASAGFIKVIKHPKEGDSEYQNAVIEGLQVSTDKGTEEDEIIVTCYFIFRDKPTSYFYDIDRKEKTLVFEFVDTRTGSSPVAALEQSPIREIVIEETQMDANKAIKGLKPEWRDMIRITFDLKHLPVISVSNEHNIISFTYKWTTNEEKIPLYLYKDKFPTVFWVSGGVLGSIGIGTLTYFLIPKKEKIIDNRLSIDDLPSRSK